jgi:hypothetical protein
MHNESTTALERQLDQAMPNWRSITAEPNWPRWLNACNPADGRLRSKPFVDAVGRRDAAYVIATLQRYAQEQREGWPIREIGEWKPRPAKPVYTRDVIRQNYLVHQRGGFISREDAWERLEHDMILAGREGRVLHPVPLAKI